MDKILGCLTGLAIGSALGAPLHGIKEGHIRQLTGLVTGFVDPVAVFPDRPARWGLRALYAGACQQALAIADVLAIYAAPDTAALADLYVRLAAARVPGARLGGHRMPGNGFRKAVEAMRESAGVKGYDFRLAGQPASGSAAAARIAPVGLYYAADPGALGRAAIEFSLLTHHDPRAVAAAVAVAHAAALLASDKDAGSGMRSGDDAAAALRVAEKLPGYVAEWEGVLYDEYADFFDAMRPLPGPEVYRGVSNALRNLPSLLRENNDALAAQTILEAANAARPAQPVANPHAPFAPAGAVMAIYRALSARSFPAGMLDAVNAGGDAESLGAIVGGLLGARFGFENIPDGLRGELLNLAQVEVRARGLQDREADWSALEDFVEMESDLSAREAGHVARALKDQEARLKKAKEKMDERKARQAAQRPPTPPGLHKQYSEEWMQGLGPTGLPPVEDLTRDPVQAKKDRALRGRKRIGWKDGRREVDRQKSKGAFGGDFSDEADGEPEEE